MPFQRRPFSSNSPFDLISMRIKDMVLCFNCYAAFPDEMHSFVILYSRGGEQMSMIPMSIFFTSPF